MHPAPQYMVVKGLLCAMVKKEGGEGTEERVGGRDGGRCRGTVGGRNNARPHFFLFSQNPYLLAHLTPAPHKQPSQQS